MILLCDKCMSPLEKPKRQKGPKGNVCQKCQRERAKMKYDMKVNLRTKGLNWSSLSSFAYDKERWYQSFILGKRESSKEMTFGSMIDKKIQDDPKFFPTLPRYEFMQEKLKVMFNGILLYGTPDGFNLKESKHLADYKTGKQAWTQKRADDHGQLTMYLLLLFISKNIRPEEFDCFIHWFPTIETGAFEIKLKDDNEFKTFKTKRTMQDLLNFGSYIKKTLVEMEAYIKDKTLLTSELAPKP